MPFYSLEPHLTPSEFITVLNNTTLGKRRSVNEPSVRHLDLAPLSFPLSTLYFASTKSCVNEVYSIETEKGAE